VEISWDDLSDCYRFAVIVNRNDEPPECAICGRFREAHILTGFRLLTAAEAKTERKRA
jgi:hypothetical protein